jgi:hypothetical protein
MYILVSDTDEAVPDEQRAVGDVESVWLAEDPQVPATGDGVETEGEATGGVGALEPAPADSEGEGEDVVGAVVTGVA